MAALLLSYYCLSLLLESWCDQEVELEFMEWYRRLQNVLLAGAGTKRLHSPLSLNPKLRVQSAMGYIHL